MGLIEVGGRPTWHEVSGSGEPVVLLHGGLSGAESVTPLSHAFVAAGHRTFVPERRGHGRTPDVDEPLTYTAMAGDTIIYLDQVVRDAAPLIGYSDGAVVALLVAMRRPDLVSRLVLIGQHYDADGRVDEPGAARLVADPGVRAQLRDAYPAGPEAFDAFLEKSEAMWAREPRIETAALGGVRTPTLVLQGDRDDVRLEHSASVVAAMPNARLAVLPGTHLLPLASPDLVAALLLRFLRS